ncbi:type I glyceraldehyde-3-phosphate dehydrogenase [bacterium]|nr:type I glyceraldehyde-3-phosphate dehydrogenase [bacterium]
MGTRVAINGFGRIGRQSLKAMIENHPDLEIVGINDLTSADTNAHLFKYDSNYGVFQGDVKAEDGHLLINGRKIKIYTEKDPANLPWGEQKVDVVVESTGIFTQREKAGLHLQAGAKKVLISAPAKGEDITIVLGVNHENYDADKHHIISNASCTTNCLAPAAKIIHDKWKIQQGMMTTIHSYTNDQRILDLPHSDMRRARAAAINIIPTSTGAAKAIALVIPDLKGKFDGFSLRVPTPTVSIVDFVCTLEKAASKDEINEAFRQAAKGGMKGILQACDEPLVSMDFKGNPHSSCVDLDCTMAMGNMVKVVTWYDNEWAYSCRVGDLITYMFTKKLAFV